MQNNATNAAERSLLGDNPLASLDVAAFAVLMAACGPFEPRPHIAVAVSGGADSLALMHLLNRWVRDREGKLTALTVDHELRRESAGEADQVSSWAAEAGIAHHILRWSGDKPETGLAAAARAARYDLVSTWCRLAGILHLATAHQLDDQRETAAMRQARGGASEMGLAGMSLISVLNGVRLLRPLLPVPGGALRHFLARAGLAWIEDPSNRDLRFERIRWRQGIEGSLPSAANIARWSAQRAKDEWSVADLFVRSADIKMAGHICVDLEPWRHVPERIAVAGLGRLIRLAAGAHYPPAQIPLARVLGDWLSGPRVMSLGGALLSHWRGQGIICREAAGVTQELRCNGLWDGRFAVKFAPDMTVKALGEAGVAEIGQSGYAQSSNRDIPAVARPALPAVRDSAGRLIFVPFLNFDPYGRGSDTHFRFLPRNSATSSAFTVAPEWQHTI